MEKVWEVFYPRRCVACDGILSTKEMFLCSKCDTVLPYIKEDYCLKCGKPVRGEEEYCSDCNGKETIFQSGRAVFLYDSLMRASVTRFKYHARKEYAAFYGKAMYQCFGEWIRKIAPDAFIPVPIHRERYRKRGYNQAELIAVELGKYCGVSVVTDYLVRTKNTLPQKEHSDRERYANLSHAFSIKEEAQELYNDLKCVIIIDDIYTTGSTISACSQVLCEQGIQRIYFLSVCIGNGF